MPAHADIKYRGFLSYSHADTPGARRLHNRLENFFLGSEVVGRETPMGPIPGTLRPIFRDREEFSAGDTLASQTETALAQSAALIVLCSPHSAKSRYVNEEIRQFKWRHPGRPVIPVIANVETLHPEIDCFPPALSFEVALDGAITARPAGVLAADLREHGDGEDLAVSKVVARLIGLGTDEVFRRAQREQRRRLRRWIAGLSVVAVALLGLSALAEFNRREAVRQRLTAERNFAVAKQGADALVFDIAQSLRNQEGMRTETVRTILGSAEQVIAKLAASAGDNKDLKRTQASMLIEFADTYATQGDSAKQGEAVEKALAILESLLKSEPENAFWLGDYAMAVTKAGDVLFSQGKNPEALARYKSALAITERLANADPKNGEMQHDLAGNHDRIANILMVTGQQAEALKSVEQARVILERLAASDRGNHVWQRDLCVAYNKSGQLLIAESKYVEAAESYGKCLGLIEPLAEADKGDARWQHDLAITHDSIGKTLVLDGKRSEALPSFEKSLAILERLAKADPGNVERQHDLAVAGERLGDAKRESGDLDGALAIYLANLARVEPLRAKDPANVNFQTVAGLTLRKAGDILMAKYKPVAALSKYQESQKIFQSLAGANAASSDRQHDLSVAYSKTGEAEEAIDKQPDALASFDASLSAFDRMPKADQSKPDWAVDAALVLGRTAGLLAKSERMAEAREKYQKARDIMAPLVAATPDNAKWNAYLDKLEKVIGVLSEQR
jgi:tetratricopeptide (TPR) repeat protein